MTSGRGLHSSPQANAYNKLVGALPCTKCTQTGALLVKERHMLVDLCPLQLIHDRTYSEVVFLTKMSEIATHQLKHFLLAS